MAVCNLYRHNVPTFTFEINSQFKEETSFIPLRTLLFYEQQDIFVYFLHNISSIKRMCKQLKMTADHVFDV